MDIGTLGTELSMLVWSTALLLLLVFIQATVGVRSQGMVMAGSRDNLPPPGVLQARTKRVVDNHREGLTIFAPLILVAYVGDLTSPVTALGAQLFFYSRVAHAVLYLFGVPMIRPLVWTVGVIGTVMVLLAILGMI